MILESIEIRDVLGFAESQSIGPLGHVSVLIGKNNAGKSNVFKAIRWMRDHAEHLKADPSKGKQHFKFEESVQHHADVDRPILPRIAIGMRPRPEDITSLLGSVWGDQVVRVGFKDKLIEFLQRGLIVEVDNGRLPESSPDNVRFYDGRASQIPPEEYLGGFAEIWRKNSSAFRDWAVAPLRAIVEINAWRTVEDKRSNDATIRSSLIEWTRPPIKNSHEPRRKYTQFERLFRELSGLQDAEFGVSEDQHIVIKSRGRYLPVEHYGDGIRHLLVFAYELTVRSNACFLVEEPETLLHPELQRRLLRTLDRSSTNQFILSTHSPVLLDEGRAPFVLRLYNDGNSTKCHSVVGVKDYSETLDDLGIRTSDLLQANVAVWVEGPSDRLFLCRCIEMVADDLSEGVQFQVICYGGSLRKYLGAIDSDQATNIFRMCRRIVYVCDSDKKTEHDKLGEEKTRVESEVNSVGGLVWTTAGRTIENYLHPDLISRTLESVAARQLSLLRLGQYDSLPEKCAEHIERPAFLADYDKVRAMKEFCSHMTTQHLDWLDLKQRIDDIVSLIREANGLRAG